MKPIRFALLALAVFTLNSCASSNPAPATAVTNPTASTPAPVSTAELEKQVIDLEKQA